MKRLPWVPYYRRIVVDGLISSDGHPAAGIANGWTIKIDSGWTENTGVLAHELAHVQLNYLNALTFGMLRLIMGQRFKLWTEARAYAIQTQYPNRDGGYLSVEAAATLLCAPRYELGLTHEQAIVEIRSYL